MVFPYMQLKNTGVKNYGVYFTRKFNGIYIVKILNIQE